MYCVLCALNLDMFKPFFSLNTSMVLTKCFSLSTVASCHSKGIEVSSYKNLNMRKIHFCTPYNQTRLVLILDRNNLFQ